MERVNFLQWELKLHPRHLTESVTAECLMGIRLEALVHCLQKENLPFATP